ncbi:MAG: IS21-like element helper ATPase IstB [Erysipelotrichaceae bacterium]|jgi:DNA replication protein DnaC
MTNYQKLLNNLEYLKLNQFKVNLDSMIDIVNKNQKTFVDALYELTQIEVLAKDQRAINACVKVAGFPFIKTLKDFDFNYQPSLNKAHIQDLATCRFLERKENIIFIGTPGVGKTHLATSIGIEAASARKITYFISCHDLILQLKKAHYENNLEKRIKHFNKYRLLIIDEVGYLPIDEEGSNLFFQLISKRYEKSSVIITTNKPLSKWVEIFHDPVTTNAILDRLLHHSQIINIIGRSYRIKDKLDLLSKEGD